jgi:hypothetical protein
VGGARVAPLYPPPPPLTYLCGRYTLAYRALWLSALGDPLALAEAVRLQFSPHALLCSSRSAAMSWCRSPGILLFLLYVYTAACVVRWFCVTRASSVLLHPSLPPPPATPHHPTIPAHTSPPAANQEAVPTPGQNRAGDLRCGVQGEGHSHGGDRCSEEDSVGERGGGHSVNCHP